MDSEKDIEKAVTSSRSDTPSAGDSHTDSELRREDETGFAPIRTNNDPNTPRPNSRASSATRYNSLGRTRSHNGYGCDEPDQSADENGFAVVTKKASRTRPASTKEDGLHQQQPGQDEENADQGDEDSWEVYWEGGDGDPMCPRSMSKARKWLIVSIVSSASFCTTAASSIYTSTYAQMDEEFGTSRIVSTLGLSTFVLGISLGPMLMGPLSEFYGRRPIYLVAWSSFVIWIIPSAVAQNIQTMIPVRFLDGFSGSAFLAVSGGTVSDLFSRQDLQFPMLIYSLAPFVGPACGPAMGGFINYYTYWRWTYYVLIIWAFVTLLLIVFLVPETYHPIVLRNKAKKLRKETGDDRWFAPAEKVSKSIIRTVLISLRRPFQLLYHETMVLSLCVFSAILLGVLYLFFGAFPLVFTTAYDFNLWETGLTFLAILVGMLLAAATDPLWYKLRAKLVARLEEETGIEGKSEPEFRLPPAIAGGFLVTIGMFIFGWTAYLHVHWIGPLIGAAFFGAGLLLVYTGIFTFLVDAYPIYAASALAANAFVRCMFAAAFPLFGNQMYEKLGFQWASSLLGFLTLAMCPFPWLFFKYGKRLRGRSKFAVDS